MKIHFSKFHGTGNDFIMINNCDGILSLSTPQVQKLCDRHMGIGADGLIVMETTLSGRLFMRYYNSDGIEASMCGNGGRCVAAWAAKYIDAGTSLVFEASDGLHHAQMELSGGGLFKVKLGMGDVTEYKKMDGGYFIDTGVPHFVALVDEPDLVDVLAKGRTLRFDERFAPKGVNVNFVAIEAGEIKVRTYERGVEDETLSCGTGVTASAIAARLAMGSGKMEWNVNSRGGPLKVRFNFDGNVFNDIILEGPAQFVFEGEIVL